MLLMFAFFLSETFWPFFILSMVCFAAAYHFSKVADAEISEFEQVGQGASPAPSLPQSRWRFRHLQVVPSEDGQDGKAFSNGECNRAGGVWLGDGVWLISSC
jgi:hypothetical protein